MTVRTPTRVVVVTGGAAGIGAAIAQEVARQGAYVVTVDPTVTLDGSASSGSDGPTTADRIVAAGGAARASAASVTDAAAVGALFADLVEEFGALDAVVNVAGISRPTSFAAGRAEDWDAVLAVHLDGYLTVLRAALPIMAAAGHGRILGVTSGSGWRAANAGAYGCAKRAVAALTWELGRAAPAGVTINALSPIAATRMVTAALEAARARAATSGSTGGLALAGMPAPEALGPIAAYLASEEFAWCSGEVLFSNGSEVAPVSPPQLLEVVRTRGVTSLPAALRVLVPEVLVPGEQTQTANGASNPRGGAFVAADGAPALTGTAVVVGADAPGLGADLAAALQDCGLTVVPLGGSSESAASALARTLGDEPVGPVSVVVTGLAQPATVGEEPWQLILDEHRGVADDLAGSAAWARAAADYAAGADRAVTLAFVTPAYTPAGRTRAQALTQLARGAATVQDLTVTAFSVAVESAATEDHRAAGELVAHLVSSDAARLGGAELGVGAGWLALRRHPAATGSIAYGGPDVPGWVDAVLHELVGR